ncbi:lipopolysaccharide biosynthesis protein [Asaia spathodeae NBRC 105894]|nr:lipopolysaccharide biosynthesis protein [Asaia spathodeae NBRC 105894]
MLKQQLLGGDKKAYHAGQISLPTFTRTYDFSELNTKLGFVNHPAQTAIEILHGGTVHLVISFDDAYMLHAIACIMSILDRASVRDALTFHVIHDESLGSPNISIIKRIFINAKIHFYDVRNDRFPGLLPRNRPHISKNTYYRLIMQDYLPREVSRIIYSDLDTIFLDDIIQLWNISMDNAILAGCLDEGGLTQSRKLFGKTHNKNYINAGVLLFDIQAAKAKYGNLRFLYAESLAKHVRNITLQDQDLLNISFVDDIIHLPLRWNVGSRIYGNNELDYAYSEADEKIAAENPAVIHFTGENKPWHADSTHPLKSIYLHYQERASQALQHAQR